MLRIPYRLPGGPEMRAALAAEVRRRRARLQAPEVQAAIDDAYAQARDAAQLLRDRFGARRVRLFGSLARRDQPDGFDMDLAVEGIAPDRFFSAWSAAGLRVSLELDLIDVRDASPLLLQRIEEDGVDLL